MTYNLLDEEWIPVLYNNGTFRLLNVEKVFEEARDIRCITLASPLDLFAVYRFLLTLIYWKAELGAGITNVRESLLNDGVPREVLNGVMAEKRCFDLFDDKLPFMQDPFLCAEKDLKSVGSLFAELSTGTNIAHFHHGDDENTSLCLQCVTLGMLRVVPWTQFGGAGLFPSIHGSPPIMAIATGDNLSVTLGLNLVLLEGKPGEAIWSGHFKPSGSTEPIAYLQALTWNPRCIFLPAPQNGVCWYCGKEGVLVVGKIAYKKNEKTKSYKEQGWRDPSAFYFEDKNKTAKSSDEKKALTNEDLSSISTRVPPPKSIIVDNNKAHPGWILVVPCTEPANNKTFDHRQMKLIDLSQATFKAVSQAKPACEKRGLDGWKDPKRTQKEGIACFIKEAVGLLTHEDWIALSNASYRGMHESLKAFDVFARLYWGLRNNKKKIGRLPSPNVAWLMLKLMASVPSRARELHPNAIFCPLQTLPKRQLAKSQPIYPVSLPRGRKLEAALRRSLVSNIRKRNPKPVDWIGLCQDLDQLFD